MKQLRKFYIYSRSSLYFLIFLAVSMLIAVIQLLIEDNFFENLTALLPACYLPSYRIFHLYATSFLISDLFKKEVTL